MPSPLPPISIWLPRLSTLASVSAGIQSHRAVESLAGKIVDAGFRRDQIERVSQIERLLAALIVLN